MLNRRYALIGLASLAVPRTAWSQTYPTRPIHIIVGYPAGGAIDMTARLLADGLQKRLGQTVVVENRSGANGAVGLEAVYRAEPDGYTIALDGASNVSAGPHLKAATFDPLAMKHITRLVKAPLTLAVSNKLPVSTVAEFIDLARSKELTFGSAGIGSSHHLTGELFRMRTGCKLLHVPYKGSGPAVQDLIAGVIDAAFGDPTLVATGKAGQIKVLGVSSDGRWSLNPDIPSIGETVPGFVSENWYGVSLPEKTPASIAELLFSQIDLVMKEEAVIGRFRNAGLEPAVMTMSDFGSYVQRDSALWKGVIQKSGIQMPG
jgi:tripartite-type tricarboxylate transporter receptor subunit TctC